MTTSEFVLWLIAEMFRRALPFIVAAVALFGAGVLAGLVI